MKAQLTITYTSTCIVDVECTEEQFKEMQSADFDPDCDWEIVDKHSEVDTSFNVEKSTDIHPWQRIYNVNWFLNNFKEEK